MKKTRPTNPSATKAKSLRVLVVDDHSLIRRSLALIVNAEPDMETCGESSTSDALALMQKEKPDVVIVDITLHSSTGLDAVKKLAFDPQIKVLVVDLQGQSTYATRAIKNGAKGYVSGEPETKIPLAIRRIVQGQLYVSEEVAHAMLSLLTSTPSGEPMDALSDRELELAELVGKGKSASEIAVLMGISIKTVETHKAHMKTKLNIAKGSQLTAYCVQWYNERHAKRGL